MDRAVMGGERECIPRVTRLRAVSAMWSERPLTCAHASLDGVRLHRVGARSKESRTPCEPSKCNAASQRNGLTRSAVREP